MADKHVMFSVVMPVYNVEQYLHNAIDSVLSQTFTDFELILVDDCTPDNSGKICDEYKEKDSRVIVVHKPVNEGLGLARNTGMEHITGEYVLFFDSDDWWEPYTLERIHQYLTNDKTDILAFGFYHDYCDKNGALIKSCPVAFAQDILATTREEIAKVAIDMDLQRNFPYAWSKAYSRKFLQSHCLAFDKTKLMEDFVFNISAFGKAESVRLIKDVFYHYIRPAHTTLASQYDKSFFDLCKMRYEKECELLENSGVTDEYYHQAVRDIFIKHILSTIVRDVNKKSGLTFKEKYRHTKSVLNDSVTKSVLAASKSSSKQIKVLQFIFKHRLSIAALLLAYIYSSVR